MAKATIVGQEIDNRAVSVVDTPTLQERLSPTAYPVILTVAAASQAITPWGVSPKRRDKELRAFWPTESWLASVVYLVSIRNAGFKWQLVAADRSKPTPRNTAQAIERVLNNSNRGLGWSDFIIKTCIDLLTQDNGAVWELIRINNDDPKSPIINLAHLDSGACQRTGDQHYPIIYTDRWGREHPLPYWRVKTLEEFPSPIESALGMQYSACSRALLAAEIIQSISVYKHEKVSGTFSRAIDIVSGVTHQNLNDALELAEEQNLNRNLYRYSLPIILPGVDPTATLSQIHIDLASLPDNFDEDTSFKWYVAQLAAAFGVDYQEIAPLMTGSLGSSQQSEIMHLKTRGKGPALFMNLIETTINNGLLPSNVRFEYLEHDVRSEAEKAEVKFTNAKTLSMYVKDGVLDPQGARDMAVLYGDIPEWIAAEVNTRDEARPREIPTETMEVSADQTQGGVDSQIER